MPTINRTRLTTEQLSDLNDTLAAWAEAKSLTISDTQLDDAAWQTAMILAPDSSSGYAFTVTVACDTAEQASDVLAERLDHDEDYGFPYTITYTRQATPPAPSPEETP